MRCRNFAGHWTLTGSGPRPVRFREIEPGGRLIRETAPVWTVSDLRRRLGKSRRQVYRYLEQGRIRPLGKVLGEWLISPAEAERVKAAARCGWRIPAKLPGRLAPLFWEYELPDVDPVTHRRLILERILEFGSPPDVRWALRAYPLTEIRAAVSRSRALSRRCAAFWACVLPVPAKEVRCLSKSFRRKYRSIWKR